MRIATIIGVAALLGACDREDPSDANQVDVATAANAAQGAVDAYADAHRNMLTTSAPERQRALSGSNDRQAARDVVTRYYASIAHKDYATARTLWDDDGAASGMSDTAFAASFDRYATYRAEIGAPGRLDTGAGQRHVAIPVRVTGTLAAGGGPFVIEGPLILHRTADIDGATPAQRSWRISDSGLRPRP